MCTLTWFLQNVDVSAELASDFFFCPASSSWNHPMLFRGRSLIPPRSPWFAGAGGGEVKRVKLWFSPPSLPIQNFINVVSLCFFSRFSFWRLQKKEKNKSGRGRKKSGGRCPASPRLLILEDHTTQPPSLWPHRKYNQGVYVAVKQIEAEEVFPGEDVEKNNICNRKWQLLKKKSASDRLKCWII